ncbi:MAG: hypothetical protein AB7F99_04265 [Vicinamibacterales bacterium]
MIRGLACAAAAIILLSPATSHQAWAQESRIAAEFRRERERLQESCDGVSFSAIGSCAMVLATGKPLHLAQGSLSPENGFGLGLAFVTTHAPSEMWRLSWSADAVRTFKGAWRAGGYMKFVHTPPPGIVVVTDGGPGTDASDLATRSHFVGGLYAQSIVLPRLYFFGLGDETSRDARADFKMRETIVGLNAVLPVNRFARGLNLSLTGEVNGRFVELGEGGDDAVPSVFAVHTDATAPGLSEQPGFLQLAEGIRIRPSFGERFRLNYSTTLSQYLADGDSRSSFSRWTVDLHHEVPFYGRSMAVEDRAANVPNDCAVAVGGETCPPISRDRRGALSVRALYMTSFVPDGSAVPFYFQPTLGGQDIDGVAMLQAFDDYRFRGPHLMLFQQSIDHTIYGPVGAWIGAEQGMVATRRADLARHRLRTSYSAGLTVVAGGFPMMRFSLGFGGDEGRHFAATINTSLLGGSSRPSLD